MELAILSLLIVAWGNYAFVCNYQFSVTFHCLQIFCCSDGDVTGMVNFLPLKKQIKAEMTEFLAREFLAEEAK